MSALEDADSNGSPPSSGFLPSPIVTATYEDDDSNQVDQPFGNVTNNYM